MALAAPKIDETAAQSASSVEQKTALDKHTDTQVAMLRGMLDAMRQPKSDDAFEILKSRFSDRALTVHLETLKAFEA